MIEKNEIITLEFEDFNISPTPPHPFFVKNKGWSSISPQMTLDNPNYGLDECAQLEEGDILLQYNNGIEEIELIKINEIEEIEINVYSIHVEDPNNYFANSLLVHNAVDAYNTGVWAAGHETFAAVLGTAVHKGEAIDHAAGEYRHISAGVVGKNYGSTNTGNIDHVGVFGWSIGTDGAEDANHYLSGLFVGSPVAINESLWIGGGRPYTGVTGAANGLNLGYADGASNIAYNEWGSTNSSNTAQTTAAYGINFGGDISMYRSGANTLKLEDNDILQLGDTDATTSTLRIGSLVSVGDVTVRNNTGAAAAGVIAGVRSYFSAQDANALTVEIGSITEDYGAIKLYNNATEKIRLDANVGIMTTTGTEDAPAIQFASANDGFYHLASGDQGINVLVNNVQEFLFANGGGFHADADITAYSTTVASDKRLKTNVQSISGSLYKLKQLRPIEFDWLVDRDRHEYGLIAQEVEKVVPELIVENRAIGDTKKFLKNLDETETFKTVDYAKLTVLLVDAVKEQRGQIEDLQQQIEEIKNAVSK